MDDRSASASRRGFLRDAAGALAAGALLGRQAYAAPGLAVDGVLELRQYTLRGRQRDVLIELFEREFLAPLNAAGAFVRGTLRDLDDPDRFVWLRGFDDLRSRPHALATFYDGPVWQRHRAAANATMVDSANVLLLRPAGAARAMPASAAGRGVYAVTIHSMNGTALPAFREFYGTTMRPRLLDAGATPILELESEPAPNNYPRLPVRSDSVFVWWARWPDERELAAFRDRWSSLSGWRDAAPESVLPALMQKPECLRLAPTAASALR